MNSEQVLRRCGSRTPTNKNFFGLAAAAVVTARWRLRAWSRHWRRRDKQISVPDAPDARGDSPSRDQLSAASVTVFHAYQPSRISEREGHAAPRRWAVITVRCVATLVRIYQNTTVDRANTMSAIDWNLTLSATDTYCDQTSSSSSQYCCCQCCIISHRLCAQERWGERDSLSIAAPCQCWLI